MRDLEGKRTTWWRRHGAPDQRQTETNTGTTVLEEIRIGSINQRSNQDHCKTLSQIEHLHTVSEQSFLITSGVSILTFWEDLGLEPLPKKQVFQIIKCLIIQLRWTTPIWKQITEKRSGCYFNWCILKLYDQGGKKDTVREQMKRTEPRNPPRMVSHSVDPSCLLNICMPAKTSTDSRLERTKEVPVFTAAMGGK